VMHLCNCRATSSCYLVVGIFSLQIYLILVVVVVGVVVVVVTDGVTDIVAAEVVSWVEVVSDVMDDVPVAVVLSIAGAVVVEAVADVAVEVVVVPTVGTAVVPTAAAVVEVEDEGVAADPDVVEAVPVWLVVSVTTVVSSAITFKGLLLSLNNWPWANNRVHEKSGPGFGSEVCQ